MEFYAQEQMTTVTYVRWQTIYVSKQKTKPPRTVAAKPRAGYKKLELGYYILILSKHILRQFKQNSNGPKGKHIWIQILGCFSLTKALILW